MDRTGILLLKMHGSVNWRVRRGHLRPFSVESIVHHEAWGDRFEGIEDTLLEMHMERDPFIVPPVLTKESLVREPILRLIWAQAFELLRQANLVVFVGYSFPITDIAAGFLFGEAISENCRIVIVNFASTKAQEGAIREVYRQSFPRLRYDQFTFVGAQEWAQSMSTRLGQTAA